MVRWVIGAAIVVLVSAGFFIHVHRQVDSAAATHPHAVVKLVQPNPERLDSHYVVELNIHTARGIQTILSRIDQYGQQHSSPDGAPRFALVLHGPEIEFFANRNYSAYKMLVDQAAALDARGVIEVKMCNKTMNELGLHKQDIPPFIEVVPYGPDEIDRLKSLGYVVM
jgi:intracellular sulfur oxidation DsrE/DsrF family protein